MSVRGEPDRPKPQLQHGSVEVERKFLVINDKWRRSAVGSVKLRDGLIVASKDRQVVSELLQGPNSLRITSQALPAAVSFSQNLSSGPRSSSAMAMM
jgi:hypothetical protein